MEDLKAHRLFDLYHQLLTGRQVEVYKATKFDDLSLNEAAKEFGISRSAVHDTVKKVEKTLKELESKLHLLHKSDKRSKLYSKIEDLEVRDELEAMEI